MRIIAITTIRAFTKRCPDAVVALGDWYKRVSRCEWSCLADIKQTFNSVDYVGNNRYVFNVKGNTYRVIVIIIFASKKVYIRFIGTHSEYDRINAKNI